MKSAVSILALGAIALAPVTAGASEDGFVALFDGESLNGWRATEENPESFSVVDGVLVVKGDRGHLFYDGDVADHDFDDFELRLEVMTTAGSNSGVYFHTQYQAEGWPGIGYEAQVNSTQSDFRKTGSLYSVADIFVTGDPETPAVRYEDGNIYAARDASPSTDGEWFDYTIRVEGQRIMLSVNGELLVDWTEPEGWERDGRELSSGTFALQAHDPDSEVHYRNIRVKVLD